MVCLDAAAPFDEVVDIEEEGVPLSDRGIDGAGNAEVKEELGPSAGFGADEEIRCLGR